MPPLIQYINIKKRKKQLSWLPSNSGPVERERKEKKKRQKEEASIAISALKTSTSTTEQSQLYVQNKKKGQ